MCSSLRNIRVERGSSYGYSTVSYFPLRYGPWIGSDDGQVRTPVRMLGLTKTGESTCKQNYITGKKSDMSITFEGGPFTKESFPYDGNKYQPIC